METEKMLPVPAEQPEVGISPELSAVLADFELPQYEPHIYLKKRTKDFKHYDSEAECRHCMKNHVDSVYNEAAKYLDITSINCLGRTVPDHYRNGMTAAFEKHSELLYRGLSEEDRFALQELCECRRVLKDACYAELSEGDYYTLYDRDYFYGLADIEEITTGFKTVGIFFQRDLDIVKYYYRNGWKIPEVLEKDVNDLARTLYNFAYNEYLNKVARPAAEILNKVEFIPETTEMEEIV